MAVELSPWTRKPLFCYREWFTHLFKLTDVMSEDECYKKLRDLRWPDGVVYPHCHSEVCEEAGRASKKKANLQYHFESCGKNVNDLTKTIFRSSHVNLKNGICCWYLMGSNVSNALIAKEYDISDRSVPDICDKLRRKVFEECPLVQLSGEVELDEVPVVAGHKGHSKAEKKGKADHSGYDRAWWCCGHSNAGKCSTKKSIQPITPHCIKAGTQTYTDGYDIYERMEEWGCHRKSVCLNKGE